MQVFVFTNRGCVRRERLGTTGLEGSGWWLTILNLSLINFSSAVPCSRSWYSSTDPRKDNRMILVCSMIFTLTLPVSCPEGWIHYHSNPIQPKRQITSTRFWNSKRVFEISIIRFNKAWFSKYDSVNTSLRVNIWKPLVNWTT